jgi:hypothetical protein
MARDGRRTDMLRDDPSWTQAASAPELDPSSKQLQCACHSPAASPFAIHWLSWPLARLCFWAHPLEVKSEKLVFW